MSNNGRFSADQDGYSEWKAKAVDIRSEAEDMLEALRGAGVAEMSAINVPREVRQLQAKVFKYRSTVAMKMPVDPDSSKVPYDQWDEELMQVNVPKAGTYDGGISNVFGEYDKGALYESIEWAQKPVNLATLVEQWSNASAVEVDIEIDNGRKTVSEVFWPTLPVAASAACLRQTDRVFEEIGWTPPSREKTIHSEVLRAHE
jgi:hypothetical protein